MLIRLPRAKFHFKNLRSATPDKQRYSLVFRIWFLFPVCHLVSRGGVTIFDPCIIEVAPLADPTYAVNASGFQTLRARRVA